MESQLDNDQRKELINTWQRFDAFRSAESRLKSLKGSMTWTKSKDREYLARSSYDEHGKRKQESLGVRSPETEALKQTFEQDRAEAERRFGHLKAVLARQAKINRAIGLGRVPLLTARIIRAWDEQGWLGPSLWIDGTNALYAYEAVAGVHLDFALLDNSHLSIISSDRNLDAALFSLLGKVDHSFRPASSGTVAINRDGYKVSILDVDDESSSGYDDAPLFEATAIDVKGAPVRMVVDDPRRFVFRSLASSCSKDRHPIDRSGYQREADAVTELVKAHFLHLPFKV